MNQIPIHPQIWKLAQAILTQRQLVVLTLREKHGFSQNQCAIHLNCTRSNVRELHASAKRNLLNAIEAAGGDVDLALERAYAKQQLDWMDEMEKTEREVFPDARPRGEVIVPDVYAEPRPTSESPEEKAELDRLWKESA